MIWKRNLNELYKWNRGNIDGTDNYQAESLFEFTLALASENANLLNLVTTPTDITGFDKATYDYNIKLQTDESKISVTPTTEDTKSTLKINVPATDADGKIGKIYIFKNGIEFLSRETTIKNSGVTNTASFQFIVFDKGEQ